MPALVNTKPQVETWNSPSATTATLDWAPLQTIDISKFDTPGGKQELADELRDAVKVWGFWNVVGSGIPQELVNRQFSIANTFFKLPLEEKRKVPCDVTVGK
jgi:isopenicillin N synthase-like dioxygenase